MTVPVVALEGAGRTFPATPPVDALKPAALTIHRGEYVGIVGPSGSGKSTLLHILGLLDVPSCGRYLLNGVDTSQLSSGQQAGLRAQEVGFVFQSFHLLPHKSALENVMLASLYSGTRLSLAERRQRAGRALQEVGLAHRADASPTTLSGGERQRVAVARALVGDISLLLADEPTGNLDSDNADTVLDLFATLNMRGTTVVVITHDAEVASRAPRRIHIRDGFVQEDPPFDRQAGRSIVQGSGSGVR